MTTSAIILKRMGRDTYKGVHLTNDGDIDFAGVTLLKHYQNTNKINKLISEGDISILRPQIGRKHPFNTRDKDRRQTTFYIRDRGDAIVLNSSLVYKAELKDLKYEIDTPYIYVWEYGTWFVISEEYSGKLSDALKPSWSEY